MVSASRSIASRLVMMGCSLLALMAAAVGYMQWQLREATTDLQTQQVEIARMGELLAEQNAATEGQARVLHEQMDAVVGQSNHVRQQAALLRKQQDQINSQADAVGGQWVVVDLTVLFYQLRDALLRYAATGDAADLEAARTRASRAQGRLQLLEMMEVAPTPSVAQLFRDLEQCDELLGQMSGSRSEPGPTRTRMTSTDMCGDAAVSILSALLIPESDRVVRNGTIARETGAEAARVSEILINSVGSVREHAAAAHAAATLVSERSQNMAALGANMRSLSSQISKRHLAIRETAWSSLLVACGVGLALFALFFRSILGPIHTQAHAMRTHARIDGSIPEPMSEDGPSELRDFAAAYNQMRAVLAASAYSKHYVDNILRSMGEGLAVCGPEGHIKLVNPALASLLCVDETQLVGQEVGTVLGLDSLDPVAQAVTSGGELVGMEVTLRPMGGAVSVLASVAPLLDDDGTCFGSVCVFLDISVRKKVEESNRILASFPEQNPGPVMRVDAVGKILYANPASNRFMEKWGIARGAKMPVQLLTPILDALDTGDVVTWTERVDEQVFVLRFSPQTSDGHVNVFGFNETARLRQESIQTLRSDILDDLASGVSLDDLLSALLDGVQENFDGAYPLLVINDARAGEPPYLTTARAPAALRSALANPALRVCNELLAFVQSESTPAYLCEDVLAEARLATLHDALDEARLHACWRLSLRSTRGESLGALLLMVPTPSRAEGWPEGLLRDVADTCALVIERQRSEQALTDSEEKYRSLVDGSILGMVVHRNSGILFANQTLARMLGYQTPEQVLEHRSGIIECFMPAEQARLRELSRARLLGQDVPSRYETELQREDGTAVAVENQVRLIQWEGQQAVQATIIDISERKRAEQEIIAASEQALAAAKTKSQFLATMSHELRTPLNGVLGMLQLMRETPLSGEQSELVTVARESGESLLALINDVLDYTRLEAGKMEVESVATDLRAVVTHVADLVRFSADDKPVEVLCDIDPDLPGTVYTDPLRLKQILSNLASNAVKFTERGSVTLEARLLEDSAMATHVQIAVVDTGIGIDDDAIGHICESFTQADNSTTRRFGGSGLGLAICKQLVKVMHGSLSVKSRKGVGSAFTLELHLAKPGARLAVQALQDGSAATVDKPIDMVNRRTLAALQPAPDALPLLIVDDNVINQKVTRSMLRKLGYPCEIAADGIEALALLEHNQYQLVLMDCQMPKMDGFEATRRIRASHENFAKIPVVALTANAMQGDRERCLQAGMDDYLGKPVRMDALRQCLERWLPAGEKAHKGRAKAGAVPT